MTSPPRPPANCDARSSACDDRPLPFGTAKVQSFRRLSLMIVVSSLSNAKAEVAARAPARVISLLSEDEEVPDLGLPAARHLVLYVENDSSARGMAEAACARADEIIRFMSDWNGEGDILVHCNRGISRSTAAAYIILCMAEPEAGEAELAARLRKAAPYADPCLMLVDCADQALHRDGRMSDAICSLPTPYSTIAAPTAELRLLCETARTSRR